MCLRDTQESVVWCCVSSVHSFSCYLTKQNPFGGRLKHFQILRILNTLLLMWLWTELWKWVFIHSLVLFSGEMLIDSSGLKMANHRRPCDSWYSLTLEINPLKPALSYFMHAFLRPLNYQHDNWSEKPVILNMPSVVWLIVYTCYQVKCLFV